MTKPIPKRLRIPLPIKMSRPLGLGDVVKHVTTAVGIKPCSRCQRRQQRLNELIEFDGRSTKR